MRSRCLLGLLLLGMLPLDTYAYQIAADSAADPAHQVEAGGAWKGLNPTAAENPPGNDNGGLGFQPWNLAGGSYDGTFSPYGNLNHFIDGVDFPASTFNNLGSPVFGLTNANQANFGYTSRATRILGVPLSVGDTFGFTFDNPVMAPLKANDTTGFILRLNTGGGPKLSGSSRVAERFGFFTTYGFNGNDWTVTSRLAYHRNWAVDRPIQQSGAFTMLVLTKEFRAGVIGHTHLQTREKIGPNTNRCKRV